MKFKKNCFSTQLSELYGKNDYQSHIELDREYWCFFSPSPELAVDWYKIKITYIRSGCAFYVLPDLPEIKEHFFPVSCFMAASLVFADIDPSKDLSNFGNELEQKMYCFDTEHTIVHNWPNEKEIEIDENDESFPVLFVMCKKID